MLRILVSLVSLVLVKVAAYPTPADLVCYLDSSDCSLLKPSSPCYDAYEVYGSRMAPLLAKFGTYCPRGTIDANGASVWMSSWDIYNNREVPNYIKVGISPALSFDDFFSGRSKTVKFSVPATYLTASCSSTYQCSIPLTCERDNVSPSKCNQPDTCPYLCAQGYHIAKIGTQTKVLPSKIIDPTYGSKTTCKCDVGTYTSQNHEFKFEGGDQATMEGSTQTLSQLMTCTGDPVPIHATVSNLECVGSYTCVSSEQRGPCCRYLCTVGSQLAVVLLAVVLVSCLIGCLVYNCCCKKKKNNSNTSNITISVKNPVAEVQQIHVQIPNVQPPAAVPLVRDSRFLVEYFADLFLSLFVLYNSFLLLFTSIFINIRFYLYISNLITPILFIVFISISFSTNPNTPTTATSYSNPKNDVIKMV